MLALAQKLHDEYVTEGQETRERLISEGQSCHDQVVGEATARQEELLSTGQAKYDEFVSAGKAKHDELIAEAEALVVEAQQKRAEVLQGLGSERGRWRSAGTTDTGPAFEGAAFFRGQPAPDSGVLAGLHGPFQAGLGDFTSSAKGLGLFYLEKRSTGVPVGEEQLGVHAQACSAVAPGHHGRDP